jgi:hypothetical protein
MSDQAELVTISTDLMWDSAGFEHAQRLAKMFASSVLVPEHLRGKLADVTIALLMARRLNEDPLIVMQNIHVIHGRAGWAAQYIIARANRSGVFKSRINWRTEGKGDGLAVTAFATVEDGSEVSFTVPMQMARDEGWTKNSKYKSMPELMLRYRSASFLVRLYAPEVMLGIPTIEEVEDAPAFNAGVSAVTAPKKSVRAMLTEQPDTAPDLAAETERLSEREVIEAKAEPASTQARFTTDDESPV